MKGLELSRSYYEEFGKPVLEEQFADLLSLVAIGCVGSGSDRFGFDDEISADHDFEPGFCIFIPGESVIDRRQEFLLERAYAKLPKEYMGRKRQPLSPVGGNRFGVIRTADFYRKAVGSPDGCLSAEQWLYLPDYALAEAVNGEIFYDEYGEFSEIRSRISHMPADIKLKRLAGNLLIMGQSGQYNYSRCLSHGEPEAARLACNEFVLSAMKVVFLLREKYMPYYKWSFRALRQLSGTDELSDWLSQLLFGDDRADETAERKKQMIEEISSRIIEELRNSGLTESPGTDLERHAYSVNDKISDCNIRNLNILAAVN
ncbi:MAG: DUF4037 domain-containing protein [Eubacteriales bacterium]|nr:DUF4037 domain-containing protein [Eubacteriales bacterium]